MAKNAGEIAAIECVLRAINGATLVDAERESPDADLLVADGFHVGVEVVQIVDPRPLHLRQRLAAASEAIRVELVRQNITGIYQMYYNLDEMGENMKAWSRDVPKQLAQFLKVRNSVSQIQDSDLRVQQIPGIAHIEIEHADRTFVGVGWSTGRRERLTLADITLAKKDVKLAEYRLANGEHFRQYWLAIASVGPGTHEDGGYSLLRNRSFRTDYDRVFLIWHGSNGRYERAEDITPA